MQHFYKYLPKGESKDDALRSAQMQMRRSPASAHPLYWASFRLNGDWT
jgi:CHAT domain-containing protein